MLKIYVKYSWKQRYVYKPIKKKHKHPKLGSRKRREKIIRQTTKPLKNQFTNKRKKTLISPRKLTLQKQISDIGKSTEETLAIEYKLT